MTPKATIMMPGTMKARPQLSLKRNSKQFKVFKESNLYKDSCNGSAQNVTNAGVAVPDTHEETPEHQNENLLDHGDHLFPLPNQLAKTATTPGQPVAWKSPDIT